MIRLFFFNDTATTEIYTLSLHDALPIARRGAFSINGSQSRRSRSRTAISKCPCSGRRRTSADQFSCFCCVHVGSLSFQSASRYRREHTGPSPFSQRFSLVRAGIEGSKETRLHGRRF